VPEAADQSVHLLGRKSKIRFEAGNSFLPAKIVYYFNANHFCLGSRKNHSIAEHVICHGGVLLSRGFSQPPYPGKPANFSQFGRYGCAGIPIFSNIASCG
jgi:hypothetical protein